LGNSRRNDDLVEGGLRRIEDEKLSR